MAQQQFDAEDYAGLEAVARSVVLPIAEMKDGARVRKPDAVLFDFAFGKTGTVRRDMVNGSLRLGIEWDGDQRIFQYPPETLVESLSR